MYDLLVKNGHVVDALNGVDTVCDVAIAGGKVVEIGENLNASSALEVLDCEGKYVVPGIIDMHTHMRTLLGHPHAQRMLALAGVTSTLDMAGPLDNILDTIPTSGAGINIAVLEGARAPQTLSTKRPEKKERIALIEKTLSHGGIGIKLLGGHFPMDCDIAQAFIEDAQECRAWIGWHVGNSVNGSNILGLRDAVEAAGDKFLHVAHVNSYCRGQVKDEIDEALEAIELLKSHPNIFSESYLSPLNGTRLTVKNNEPVSQVTVTCLKRLGFSADYDGMRRAILSGKAGVLRDNGTTGELIYGQEGVDYWISKDTVTTGSFSVNPATSRFLLAQAKRDGGSFVVDAFSTDGGCYPRNVIVENGLLLVQFGAITMTEFVIKSSLNGARALNLPNKGHLGCGADADISVLDFDRKKAYATIASGKIIMREGKLCGRGTKIICDERGEKYLKERGIETIVKGPLEPEAIADRFHL